MVSGISIWVLKGDDIGFRAWVFWIKVLGPGFRGFRVWVSGKWSVLQLRQETHTAPHNAT